ncbi:hypothetical protein NXS19_013719, partial [Fusarium pseudograminearum]
YHHHRCRRLPLLLSTHLPLLDLFSPTILANRLAGVVLEPTTNNSRLHADNYSDINTKTYLTVIIPCPRKAPALLQYSIAINQYQNQKAGATLS